jgi:hypothetical protein
VLVTAAIAGAVAAVFGAVVAVVGARRRASEHLLVAKAEAAAVTRGAKLEAASIRRAAETEAREASLELRSNADVELTRLVEDLARRGERIVESERTADEDKAVLDSKWAAFKARKQAIQSMRDRAKSIFDNADAAHARMRDELADRAGETPEAAAGRIARVARRCQGLRREPDSQHRRQPDGSRNRSRRAPDPRGRGVALQEPLPHRAAHFEHRAAARRR